MKTARLMAAIALAFGAMTVKAKEVMGRCLALILLLFPFILWGEDGYFLGDDGVLFMFEPGSSSSVCAYGFYDEDEKDHYTIPSTVVYRWTDGDDIDEAARKGEPIYQRTCQVTSVGYDYGFSPEYAYGLLERAYANKVTSVTISEGVKFIRPNAFRYFSNLTSVTLPSSVTHIGARAFQYCALSSLKLPEHLEEIGDEAFSCCDFTEVVIPDTIKSIGSGAFQLTGIGELHWPRSLTTVTPSVCSACYNLEKVILHEDVQEIGECAFFSCSNLKNINLQDTRVSKIGRRAFDTCQLHMITLPATVKDIGDEAFYDVGAFGHPAFIVFKGRPPNMGESVFEMEMWRNSYLASSIDEWRANYSVSPYTFGVYRPDADSADVEAWQKEIDEWGRWHEVQMTMDVRPIACDYTTDSCGELNISWRAFPAYTNHWQKWQWHFPVGDEDDEERLDEYYVQYNWLAFADQKFSIWRSSENPDDPYDDFSCASNIAQHVGGEFSDEKGFSATNFIDKTFGKFKGTKPVKYWIEFEDPNDPDNLQYLSDGATRPSTRIRPMVEPDSCVTRRRFCVAVGVSSYDKNASGYASNPPPEELSQPAKEAQLFNQLLANKVSSRYDRGFVYPQDESFAELKVFVDSYATLDNVRNAITNCMCDANGVRHTLPGDIFFFYVSTHGATNATKTALAFYDGRYFHDEFCDDFRKFDKDSGVKVIGVIMACHSEGMLDGIRRDGVPANMAWITAARREEEASAVEESDEYSQFAQFFLVHGWQNRQADRNVISHAITMHNMDIGQNDGSITALELARYTKALSVGRSDRWPATVCIVPNDSEILSNTIMCDYKTSLFDIELAPDTPSIAFVGWSERRSLVAVEWYSVQNCNYYLIRYHNGGGTVHWRMAEGENISLQNSFGFNMSGHSIIMAFSSTDYYPLVSNADYYFTVSAIGSGGISRPSKEESVHTPNSTDVSGPDGDGVGNDSLGGDNDSSEDSDGGGDSVTSETNGDMEVMKAPTLFGPVMAELPFTGDATYNGWVRSADGTLAGLLTVKAGKAAKPEKGGQSKIAVTYTPFGGRKQTIKLPNDAMPVAGEVATVTLPDIGTVKFTGNAIVGVDVDVQAGKDTLKSKDREEKAAATAFAAGKAGTWTFALGTDVGYAAFSVTVDKKGKGKFAGTLPDGTKVSASAQGVLGDGALAIPLAYAKKGSLGLVFWVKGDGTAVLSDLTKVKLSDGTEHAATVVAPNAVHRLSDGAHTFTAGGVSQGFTVAGKKWNVPKQNKKADPDPNPTGLKLAFTEKTGAVKGTFTVVDGTSKTKYTVVGAVVGGKFCGAAYTRNAAPIPATAE